MQRSRSWSWLLVGGAALAASVFLSCGTPRLRVRPPPPPSSGRPISDPPPSRVVVHTTIFREGLTRALAAALPRHGEGDVDLMAGQRLHYTWQREPVTLRFDRGRLVVGVAVNARTTFVGERQIPIKVTIAGEPVVTADFKAVLQSTEVAVKAESSLQSVNQGIEEKLKALIARALDEFRMDVRPLVMNAFSRIARPLEIPLGDHSACVELKIVSLEAAPTVLADGVEKDLGLVILPSVTLPCSPESSLSPVRLFPAGGSPDAGVVVGPEPADARVPTGDAGVPTGDAGVPPPPTLKLPLLQNVASLPSGPFTVVVPVAARYEELSAAIDHAIDGKLFFSRTHPELYLHHPQVYASDDQVVIRVLLGGKASVAGTKIDMDGEIFFSGHPRVIDNQITVPDLDITPGTAGELLKLKLAVDHDSLVAQARAAIRVDVSERLAAIKDKLSTELTFAEDMGCMRATVFRSEVTGIFPHQSFLRIYLTVDAQAGLYLPCKR